MISLKDWFYKQKIKDGIENCTKLPPPLKNFLIFCCKTDIELTCLLLRRKINTEKKG